ncbi:SIS domain-containing protein [Leptospira biflexa]|uniref:SIS domain-containing protein n=1 Tax=Leptospira biflexa TaxID=172 RepID=UPI0010843B45|nr:SIS domain-containing protein [Leptospira biflexa]TGM34391.1 SIS domain-containing protein [Leptospira biflexa]TGM39955.1 SIS domain-containing protein [Leptospira biflexa]TGM48452.1 SIS domain-containing protein [Leptospira biflexa]TGM49082.1 SIS domain-containing protein [Leptospira biflexa]TGM54352.1 SIS domain-containing protein [Leptospira biflexa]
MEHDTLIQSQIEDSIRVKAQLLPSLLPNIKAAGEILVDSLKDDGILYFAGNGGSSCDASHIAAELVIRYKSGNERKAIPAIALNSDQAVLTACANDYGYEFLFQRQLQAFGKSKDVFIGLTTSGNSKNIILAVEEAQKNGMKVVLLLGGDGGKLKGKADVEIIIPSSVTARIQESHILIGHILCSIIEKELFGLD